MIDQHTKQEIANALIALNDQNASLRIDAVKRIGEIGISHPQIIERLKNVTASDWSADVRATAMKVLDTLQNSSDNIHQKVSIQPQLSEPTIRNEEAILEILQKQHETLASIKNLLVYSLEKENEKSYRFRSRITDLDLSIGSMINMSFKWLIASIPVGFVLGFILIFFASCTAL